MATTIQISEKTKQTLEILKQDKKIKTNDEALQYLLNNEVEIPSSMFGVLKGKKLRWEKEDEFDFNES